MHLPHVLSLSVFKVIGAFLPGALVFAVGVDGVANNPITVTDVGLMVAGLGLMYFGRIMLQTRDSVIALDVRVTTLEDKDKIAAEATRTAAGVATAVTMILEAQKRKADAA